jgi:hypothetical protein
MKRKVEAADLQELETAFDHFKLKCPNKQQADLATNVLNIITPVRPNKRGLGGITDKAKPATKVPKITPVRPNKRGLGGDIDKADPATKVPKITPALVNLIETWDDYFKKSSIIVIRKLWPSCYDQILDTITDEDYENRMVFEIYNQFIKRWEMVC